MRTAASERIRFESPLVLERDEPHTACLFNLSALSSKEAITKFALLF